jgi:hypothetical protein
VAYCSPAERWSVCTAPQPAVSPLAAHTLCFRGHPRHLHTRQSGLMLPTPTLLCMLCSILGIPFTLDVLPVHRKALTSSTSCSSSFILVPKRRT